ncbi:hypothetical protein CERZMDRAFT_104223 [Cercospora zeae-maydis SCOH1-5]|uniref:Potassium transporter n=1 Tax=Cercospora zeae-maydis SCOH1-5 TaxID=717836 RepID=A0A6A6FWD6_9PEZI|nr:hypothetical protein CERZMDRAFT_104223 [Cercospora zeae-maydis SCOH1-5]
MSVLSTEQARIVPVAPKRGNEKRVVVDDAELLPDDVDLKIRDGDLRQRQDFKGWTLLLLAYQATGVIYGDIGTSPLYVYSSTFSSPPSRPDVLGVLSFIIWSLTLIVTLKYVLIVLRADDDGEGGTFAIYTLLSRYSDIMKRDPRVYQLVKTGRHKAEDLHVHNQRIRSWLEKSKIAHAILKLLAVFGVSLILADGVLTPAQSVLGAIQGIEVVDEGIKTSTIVGTSCAILVVLFLLQPLGIHRVSSAFAPIVIIWLLFNGCFGIYNLAKHDAGVLKAFSPYFAGAWLMRTKTEGWKSLGGVLLCFTGVECLFADMGAFSRRAIQLSWLCFAYPCLLLAYIGQAAYLVEKPEGYSNPFFKTVPPGLFWPSLVLAILAAIVASQATITACFQLLAQIMNSSYFPQIQMHYTSTKHHGQVYIPIANWVLMVGCVIVTAVYNNTTKLGHAYGVCVILVTFITTNLVALAAVIVWRVHPAITFAVWLPLIVFDGLFLSASLVKVPDGAWFTLMLAACLAAFFGLWRYGKETQWLCEAEEMTSLTSLVSTAPDGTQKLSEKYGGSELFRIDGLGVFLDKSGLYTPKVYEQWLRKFRAQLNTVVFMHLRALSMPHVSEEQRFEVSETNVKDVYRVIIRHGYKDHVITPDLAALVCQEIRSLIVRQATAVDDAATAERVNRLEAAFAAQTLYMVGKQQMRISPSYNFLKRAMLEIFLWVRENSRSKVEKLDVPAEKIVEVGFVGEI